MSTYAWIIDRDHLHENDPAIHTGDDTGVVGPSDAPEDLLEILKASKSNGRQFQMLDDDGELYYSGRITFKEPRAELVTGDLADLPEEAFGPLWDYGTPNAGCTEIRYQRAVQHVWTQL